MTCRDEVLAAFKRLERRHGSKDFSLEDVVLEVQAHSTSYKESTVRTHISSRMCRQAPAHHAVRYPDLDRVFVSC